MLAYYVEWHMRKALAPLLFHDEQLDADRKTRDPVAAPVASEPARRKKSLLLTPQGQTVHSFRTLIAEMGTLSKNQCRMKSDSDGPIFSQLTEPTPFQARVFELLGLSQ